MGDSYCLVESESLHGWTPEQASIVTTHPKASQVRDGGKGEVRHVTVYRTVEVSEAIVLSFGPELGNFNDFVVYEV